MLLFNQEIPYTLGHSSSGTDQEHIFPTVDHEIGIDDLDHDMSPL